MKLLEKHRTRAPETFDLGSFEDWVRSFFEANGLLATSEARVPRSDVSESDGEYRFSVELPGIEEKDVDVRISGDRLIVSGERKQRHEEKSERFHRVECSPGAFERSFLLPSDARRDAEDVGARFDKGMLEIRVRKAEPTPMVQVPVQSALR